MAVDVGSIDASLSTGIVSYSSVGFLPKAVIFWGNLRATSGKTDATEGAQFYGMTDGVTSGSFSVGTRSGGSPANTYVSRVAVPVHMVDRSGTTLMSANFVSFDNDGFTLDWTVAAGSSYDIHFMALGGVDFENIFVGSELITATGSAAVTGLGFQPDGLIGFAANPISSVPAAHGGSPQTYSCIGLTDGTRQGAVGTRWGTGFVTIEARFSSDHWLNSGRGTGDKLRVDLTTMDVDGFTYDATIVDSDTEVLYMAIKADSLYVGTIQTPLSTGTVAETGVGFLPEGVFSIFGPGIWNSGGNSTSGNPVGTGMCMGAADGSNQVSTYYGVRDNGTTRYTGFSSSKTHMAQAADVSSAEELPSASETISFFMDSLDADGFTLDHDVVLERGGFFYMALLGGSVAQFFDNKIIYADGIDVQ